MAIKLPIYMDYHATTPVDPRVLDAMLPYFSEKFGNAASRSHVYGWTAEEAVSQAREKVAALIGAQNPKEIVFTSGATESNNLALRGVAAFYRDLGDHIVTTTIEHKAILQTVDELEASGLRVTRVPVGPEGLVDPRVIAAAIEPSTLLVSVMLANNEIGTINDLAAIGEATYWTTFFGTDAMQYPGVPCFRVFDLAFPAANAWTRCAMAGCS